MSTDLARVNAVGCQPAHPLAGHETIPEWVGAADGVPGNSDAEGPAPVARILDEVLALPECDRRVIGERNGGVDLAGAKCMRTSDGFGDEPACDAAAAPCRFDDEPVKVASPAVPPDDETSGDQVIDPGDEQSIAIPLEERSCFVEPARKARGTSLA